MTEQGVRPVRRALVSVADKTGLEDLGHALVAAGASIVSSGSTANTLAAAGIPVTAVSDVTGFPEVLDGRVKTLHPRVHAAAARCRRGLGSPSMQRMHNERTV